MNPSPHYLVTLVCLLTCLNNRNYILLLGVAGTQVIILTKVKKHAGLELPCRGMKLFRTIFCGTNPVSHWITPGRTHPRSKLFNIVERKIIAIIRVETV